MKVIAKEPSENNNNSFIREIWLDKAIKNQIKGAIRNHLKDKANLGGLTDVKKCEAISKIDLNIKHVSILLDSLETLEELVDLWPESEPFIPRFLINPSKEILL